MKNIIIKINLFAITVLFITCMFFNNDLYAASEIKVIPENTKSSVSNNISKENDLERIDEEVEDTEVVGSTRNGADSAAGKKNLPDYSISVNKATNTVTVYKVENKGTEKEKKIPYKEMLCSVGRWGHDTPEGQFKIYEYYDWRLMNDYTYGRYAVRFNGSIMFHSVPYFKMAKNSLEWEEFNKLGRPASLGCVRLCVAEAKWIYANCKPGTEVTVYSDSKDFGPFGKPIPIKIDVNSKYRDWDPTDLTKENPLLVTID